VQSPEGKKFCSECGASFNRDEYVEATVLKQVEAVLGQREEEFTLKASTEKVTTRLDEDSAQLGDLESKLKRLNDLDIQLSAYRAKADEDRRKLLSLETEMNETQDRLAKAAVDQRRADDRVAQLEKWVCPIGDQERGELVTLGLLTPEAPPQASTDALRSFQKANGLVADGCPGPRTVAALVAAVHKLNPR